MVIRIFLQYVGSKLKKIRRNYNVIERTDKLIEKEKLEAAPRHPGVEEKIRDFLKANPSIVVEVAKKDADLLERLKIIKVDSESKIEGETRTSQRELPQKRDMPSLPNFGYEEPKIIPEGKCSLRQALEFIKNYQNDSKKWSYKEIASNYKLKELDVEHITKNFRIFEIYIPQKTSMKTTPDLSILGSTDVQVRRKYVSAEDILKTNTKEIKG